MTEHEIQSMILLDVSKKGHKIWRSNAGKVKDARTGNWINLLPKGFPDTFGFRKDDGKFFAIEVKTKNGRLREEQKRFAKFAEKQPILYGVARSVEEALKIIETNNEKPERMLREIDQVIEKNVVGIQDPVDTLNQVLDILDDFKEDKQ